MFNDRLTAAQQLVPLLAAYKNKKDIVVLAVVRGGVPLGVVIAHALGADLDICLSKKIGAPFNEEFAIGAVTPETYFVEAEYDTPELQEYISERVREIQQLLKTRAANYRQGRAPVPLKNKTVILVDDGIATGRTILAAIGAIRAQRPKKIIVACPLIAADTIPTLRAQADDVVYVLAPQYLGAIGAFYARFEQVEDEEVKKLLRD